MAVINAAATGNWSNTATWPGGVLPGASDDVYANGKTITIDQNVTVLSLNTTAGAGGVAGGGFIVSTAQTINANLFVGITTCLTITATTGTTVTVNGNITAGTASNGYGAYLTGTGTLAITGNVIGGSGSNAYGVYNSSTGTLAITGTVTGGSGSNAYGAINSWAGTITITGNVTGGSGSIAYGVYNSSTGTLAITGNVIGGSGVAPGAVNNSTGTITISGNVTAGANSVGSLVNNGLVLIGGNAIGNNWVSGSTTLTPQPGVKVIAPGLATVGGYQFGTNGMAPTIGNVLTLLSSQMLQVETKIMLTSLSTEHGSGSYARNTEPDNASIATILSRTDVATSTRSSHSAADVWTSATRTLSSYGTLIADIWASATRTLTAFSDSSGVTTLLSRLTSGRAGNLDNLDATVSSRNATAPDNASIATILARTDVAISTRSSHSATDIWAVGTRSLTTFGTLVADIWGSATRTLTAFSDSSGVTSLLSRLTSGRAGNLDNLDATVSSRNATAPDNTSIATILTRTDVATSTRSSHSAADIWAVGTRSLTTFGTLVADVAAAVWAAATRTLSAFGFTVNTNANATETAIKAKTDTLPAVPASEGNVSAVGSAVVALGAPLQASSYTAPANASIAAIKAKTDPAAQILLAELYTPTGAPAVIIPGAPADLSLCRVYGYFENLDNSATDGIAITFQLSGSDPVKSERFVDPKKITARIVAGRITNSAGDPWQDLQRNDQLTPAGTTYLVGCSELRLRAKVITLADDLFDLSSIIP